MNGAWETGTTSFRGQWGLSQDDFGRLYHGSNSDHLRVDVISSDYLRRNPHIPQLAGTNVNGADNQLVWPSRVTPGINRGYRPEMLREGRLKEFTAACGFWIYRGDLIPEFYGNLFVAEPAAHFVRRSILSNDKGTVRGRNAYDQQEFIASTDERFRPVSFATGPDGALYVVDLYRGVLQHRISLTSYLRKQSEDRGLVDPQNLGRIYRVVPTDKPVPRATQLAPLTTAQWVERLSHPNGWWRETAQRILVERRDPAVIPAIRAVARSGARALGRMHALWTLDGMAALDRETVAMALGHPADEVRTAAIRLSEPLLASEGGAELAKRIMALAKSGSPEVQLQAVLTLGNIQNKDTDLALAEIVRAHPQNTFLQDAFLSGIAGRELDLLERLIAQAMWSADDVEANKLFTGLARAVHGARQQPAIERVLARAGKDVGSGGVKRAVALVDGMVPTIGSSRRPFHFSQEPAGWSALEKNPTTKARLARLNEFIVWPGKAGAAALTELKPLTGAQQARFETGRTLFAAVCATCHQADGRGLDGLAPPLLDSEWVLGPEGRMVRIVLQGVRGPIRVLGRIHVGDMPAFGALDDHQVSSILTYLRREWGHTASPVDPEQVAEIRAATAGHTDAWSPEELMLIK